MGTTSDDEPTTGDEPSVPTTGGDETTGEPPAQDDRNVFFVAARKGDEAFVLRVSPAAGTAEAFGPALPVPADELGDPRIVATPDKQHVTLRCYFEPEVPVATLLVGDGSAWTEITKYNKFGLGGSDMAPDASLMWFDEIAMTDDGPTYQATVIRPVTGEVIFKGEPLTPDDSFNSDAFGPGGGWFSYRDPKSGTILRTAGGAEVQLPAERTHVVFPKSVIVTDFTQLMWVGLDGAPLAVPGFSTVYEDVAAHGYQVVDGVLSLLGDGTIEQLQKVPDMRGDQIYRHVAGVFAVGFPQSKKVSTIGLDGAVIAAFEPSPSPNKPEFGEEIETWYSTVANCLGCSTGSVAFIVRNSYIDGDVSEPADSSVQLWRLDDQGAAIGQTVPSGWKEYEDGPWHFNYSADGAHLVWAEEGQLLRLDVESGVVQAIATPFQVLP